jgi:hypothetical protein
MSDVSEGARELDAGFRYVLEVYRNVSRMLLGCDAMLQPYRFAPYASWGVAEAGRRASEPAAWLPHRLVRQYHPPGRQNTEILTIGAYLYNPHVDAPIEPVCVASMIAVTSTPDAVYRLGMVGAVADVPRGEVVAVDGTTPGAEWAKSDLARIVRDRRVLSIGVPLLEVTSTTHVEARLVKPLVARLAALPDGGYAMPPAP